MSEGKDERFAAMYSDPRFSRFPKKKNKVEIDKRFAGASVIHARVHLQLARLAWDSASFFFFFCRLPLRCGGVLCRRPRPSVGPLHTASHTAARGAHAALLSGVLRRFVWLAGRASHGAKAFTVPCMQACSRTRTSKCALWSTSVAGRCVQHLPLSATTGWMVPSLGYQHGHAA